MLICIIPNTTANNNTITTKKISAALALMVNAIIIEPKTINGERINSLKAMFTPFCT
ncbi:hypothetical protein SDC9_140599 [bioreactor metagenome]|uniref:Uncharacterized protein n=1 Tax=bioreactor metagenome TaxID=1076179 RepID=A0A645DYQ3_9ZZZZ